MGTSGRVVLLGLVLLVCAAMCLASRTLVTPEHALDEHAHNTLAHHSGDVTGTEAATTVLSSDDELWRKYCKDKGKWDKDKDHDKDHDKDKDHDHDKDKDKCNKGKEGGKYDDGDKCKGHGDASDP